MIVFLLIVIIIILVPSLIGIFAGTAVGLGAYIVPIILGGLIMYGCDKAFAMSDEVRRSFPFSVRFLPHLC